MIVVEIFSKVWSTPKLTRINNNQKKKTKHDIMRDSTRNCSNFEMYSKGIRNRVEIDGEKMDFVINNRWVIQRASHHFFFLPSQIGNCCYWYVAVSSKRARKMWRNVEKCYCYFIDAVLLLLLLCSAKNVGMSWMLMTPFAMHAYSIRFQCFYFDCAKRHTVTRMHTHRSTPTLLG